MPNERTIPSEAPRGAVSFTILSENNAVSRAYQVLSIVTGKEVNRIPVATITIMDGSASEQTFKVSNQPDFEPGKHIEIKAGYEGTEETIFKGIVIRHSIKIREQSSVLLIECRDEAVKMTVVCKNKYFRDVTDSDIIETLIDNHGLSKTVAATTLTHKEVVQYNATDWDLMLCRSDMNGMLCIVNDGEITVDKPALSADPVLTIQYGATVYDLDAEIDARLQFKKVTATAWKPAEQALIDGIESEDPQVPDAGNLTADVLAGVVGEDGFALQHSGTVDDQELQQWANAKMLKHRLAKIRGKVRTDGTALVLPGKFIMLNGVGERFEGKLFVTAVRHEIEMGRWHTICQFGLNPEWFTETYNVQQPMAAAMLPAIQGLQIGVVTKLEGDPDGEDRIMVRLPVVQAEDDGIWSRISTLDAGNNRGTFFRPEIGDEVIVGFINNDPRHAVILGMCNSSKKPAPLPAGDDNHEKGYVSRSEMKLIFNDDKKTITIETPGGNKLLISDDEKKIHMEDQNGNKFTMDQDGIKLESTKDIVMIASADIKAEAGANANIKGSAQAKVEGGSAAELSSGASTTIKGSVVQIN